MNLETAISRIRQAFRQMNEVYQRTVFDELAIVGIGGDVPVVHFYEGPRQMEFSREFADRTVTLRKELPVKREEHGGEFGFTREGEGDHFDAYICLGPDLYLFCNNTKKSMHEVTQDPRWLGAQQKFLNACQPFAAEPLQIP